MDVGATTPDRRRPVAAVAPVETLWLRADASPEIGLGHLMRAIALAEAAVAAGVVPTIVTRRTAVSDRVLAGRDIAVAAPDAIDGRPDAIVVDGYHLVPEALLAARGTGAVVCVFDDWPGGSFDADVVVNPSRLTADYETPGGATVLLGPAYAQVRQEILGRRRARQPAAGRLLVTMGGADPRGLGPGIARVAARTSAFASVALLVGPGGRGIAVPGVDVVMATEVSEMFDAVDAVVTAAGTTTWELLALGLPIAAVLAVDNQAGVVATLAELDTALVVEDPGDADAVARAVISLAEPGTQRRLAARALATVDGGGGGRVLAALDR